MTFETKGFFSEEAEDFRRYVRSTEPFNKWFHYGLGLVQIGLEMLRPLETTLANEQLLYLNAAFVRVHQALQSALILAERGLILDARVVLRSAAEFAIAINALAHDVGFV